ncbi:hypothetical protein A7K91_00125 [Paenibacillus oryzae]|uniref:Uncharacterized protein n=1 Tax=Paenibacillus oryzae TaxID=1844972 RepID=A0A1A5YMU2_9BACL|nr:hypothetical protein [Paenibacillus oryzae]OBR66725.1 hypothetical protein A7K91_00125 [Paenibacillus oryzae]
MRQAKKVIIYLLGFILLLLPVLTVLPSEASASCHWVKGHTRNGKYVSGYWRGCGGSSSGGSSGSTSTTPTSPSSPSNPSSSSSSSSDTTYGATNIVNLYKGKKYVGTADASKLVFVKGYYTADGTYVRPHFRTHANDYVKDNFSYQNISTLLPKAKYPSYKYDSNQNVATIEKYLLYNNVDYNLNTNQLSTVKEYAKLLYQSGDSSIAKDKAVQVGTELYQGILSDKKMASLQVKFDVSGEMSLEDYLLQVVNSSAYMSRVTVLDVIIPVYAQYLREAQADPTKVNDAKTAGINFYSIAGGYGIDIANQVEMDMLQSFQKTDERRIYSVNSLNLDEVGNSKYDFIETYLTAIGQVYNITFDPIDIIGYKIDLYFINKYVTYSSLEFALQNGKKLYEKYGLSSDMAIKQAENDVRVFLGKLSGI